MIASQLAQPFKSSESLFSAGAKYIWRCKTNWQLLIEYTKHTIKVSLKLFSRYFHRMNVNLDAFRLPLISGKLSGKFQVFESSMANSNALLPSRSSTGALSMAESQAVASSMSLPVAGVEVHMNLQEVDQGPIRFEKTLTPLNVPNGIPNSRCSLEIPPWFVKQHGDKLEEFVILRCATSAQPRAPWVLRISVSAAAATPFPSVRMSCGWQKFAVFHGLRDGDSLMFRLRALSEFEVIVYPGSSGWSASSRVTSVNALCEPMQQLLAVGDHTGAIPSSTMTTLPPISKLDQRFPMDPGRVISSSRSSESPPTNHPERAVSFCGIDTVYVDTHALPCTPTKDHSQIPKFLLNF